MKVPTDLNGKTTGPGPGPVMSDQEGPGHGMEIIGLVLSIVWAGLVLMFMLLSDPGDEQDTLGLLATLLMVFLPVALIWVVVITLRSVRSLRAEAARLQATVEAMRASYVQTQSQLPGSQGKTAVERKIDEIAASTRQAETVLTTFISRRDAALTVASADRKAALVPQASEPAAEQPVLALGSPPDDLRPPLPVPEVIRALHFPESPEDREGFRALRIALEDRVVAKLIRASQDVLTLLGGDGIFMDDLIPDRAHPDLWRRFAGGERGRSIAALGGIRDRSSLALSAARMRQDTIFRDAAHHFLRQFDRSFQSFEKTASDGEIAAFTDTRTARAFMLLGRVSGTFD